MSDVVSVFLATVKGLLLRFVDAAAGGNFPFLSPPDAGIAALGCFLYPAHMIYCCFLFVGIAAGGKLPLLFTTRC
jgi:hypothetical protein